jgi:hypothetical protein
MRNRIQGTPTRCRRRTGGAPPAKTRAPTAAFLYEIRPPPLVPTSGEHTSEIPSFSSPSVPRLNRAPSRPEPWQRRHQDVSVRPCTLHPWIEP